MNGIHGVGGEFAFLTVALLKLLFGGGVLLGYIIFLVAVWRGVKAHESLAQSAREIAENLRPRS